MTVRAVVRSMKVLEQIVRLGSSNITDLTRVMNLPRSTIYRAAATLIKMGYLVVDPETKILWPGPAILKLNSEQIYEAKLLQDVQPTISEFSTDFRWPVLLLCPREEALEVVLSTCSNNPNSIKKPVRGDRVPLNRSASGTALMAARVSRSPNLKLSEMGFGSPDTWLSRVMSARSLGYALQQSAHDPEAVVATHFNYFADRLGVVAFRYIRSAVNEQAFKHEILPRLRTLSSRLSAFSA